LPDARRPQPADRLREDDRELIFLASGNRDPDYYEAEREEIARLPSIY
jgi:hypothetical protein